MEGAGIIYEDFMVYPEHCGLTTRQLSPILVGSGISYTIATIPAQGMNMAVVTNRTGEIVYTRGKHRLYRPDEKSLTAGQLPEVVKLGNNRVLILICYELMFPEDYLNTHKEAVDFVVHMVGHPMYNMEQKEAWVALQKAVSLWHRCPMVCCCGGKRGPMNITGVIKA